jgi:hypothetical protein
MMSPQSREKLTSNGSFANYVTTAALNTITGRLKKKSIKGDPDMRSSQHL